MFFETKNLCFSYYKCPLCLKDVNISFEKNEKILLLASKDSGKTTALKVFSGFEDSRFGNIFLEGKEIKEIEDKDKNFSLVLSEPVFFEGKTIRQNFDYLCDVCQIERLSSQKLKELLNEFEIDKDESIKIKKLSIVEKRKLQIARSNLKKPTILFLDDQFEDLNDDETNEMFNIYKKLMQNKSLTGVFAIGDGTYKKIGIKLNDFKIDKIFYLNLAKIHEYKALKEFDNCHETFDMLKFFENVTIQNCYIEKDGKFYSLCQNEERLFVFDNKYSKKLSELNLEFGDVEYCFVYIKSGELIKNINQKEFFDKIDKKEIFIYSSTTENLVL